ncbi:related to nucleotide exsicion repair protein RAD16 [Rhynchosporium agropyri]|uniref:Related to nucleotide exsicion repair protein RAD16 n=1 Tax=Rhynchosporium agropyri TaxID=914238 RepID=A0A1E1K7F7_9HELO|nr:related to nucleotide exsicion repair protein RAD16 [Rhynchosporium agropyri]
MPPKRGRPRKEDSASNSPAISRPSTRRAAQPSSSLEKPNTYSEPNIKSRVSSNDTDELNGGLSELVKMSKKSALGRESLSSVSASLNEGSGYSTPATSAATTPAPGFMGNNYTKKRGRPTGRQNGNIMSDVIPPAINAANALARATALRNSQYSMASTSHKRKRVPDSEDDDEDAGEEHSSDAQLARELQDQEDAAAISMAMDEDDEDHEQEDEVYAPRRAPRKLRKIQPKTRFVADSEDDDLEEEEEEEEEEEDLYGADDIVLPTSRRQSNGPKVELGAKGKNLVTFTASSSSKKKIIIFDDSDETEDEFSIEDRFDSDGHSHLSKAKTTKKSLQRGRPSASTAKASVAGPSSKKGKTAAADSDKEDDESDFDVSESDLSDLSINSDEVDFDDSSESDTVAPAAITTTAATTTTTVRRRRGVGGARRRVAQLDDGYGNSRQRKDRARLESHHPDLLTMWKDLEDLPKIGDGAIEQPKTITRELKPFQLQGVHWMIEMEKTDWAGGLLGDEMGMGKTIQAVSLIMSDFPAKQPSLVLMPPVAIMQWQSEIKAYTDGTLKTFVYHGTNTEVKNITYEKLMKYDVILITYNSLESMFRKQEKGFPRKGTLQKVKEKSVIHRIHFHRVILDEAHSIKSRTTGSAKACFALKADHKWCLSGTPLQNRIGEFFSLIRFLDIRPFACYMCKQCPCSTLNWDIDRESGRCTSCSHSGMHHVSVFNQELLNPIQLYGNQGPGKEAFRKLGILTGRFMLRRVKRDHSSAMELPAKEIRVDRQFFGEEENDFANSIMNSGTRKFETYVAQGVMLNNYANIFGLIMQMRQVADHPDLILKKNSDGGQNVIVCCICDETAEEAIRSACRHDFCRECAKSYMASSDEPDCPQCHIALAIDLEQPDIEQDEQQVKKSSIINRIKMENWTSSSKIETLVHDLYSLRSKNSTHKSIIFSQFTTMLQLVEWRLRRAGITTVMLDGSMTPAQRQASISHFKTDVNVECFLVSLKAGGVALNLTEASKVFIVDPWWNPAAEWQSADRCHRIGQGRPCEITRLCIEDSVESRMVLLQEKKANMINSTINSDAKAMESLTPEDMQFLFRGS